MQLEVIGQELSIIYQVAEIIIGFILITKVLKMLGKLNRVKRWDTSANSRACLNTSSIS